MYKRQVYTGIAGSHIRSFNSSGMVAIKDKEVNEADMARVIETAKAVNIPTDQQIVHVLPQEFIIDGQEDIRCLLSTSDAADERSSVDLGVRRILKKKTH